MDTLHSLVEEIIGNHASKPAVVYDDCDGHIKTLSYRELWDEALIFASEFTRLSASRNIVALLVKDNAHLPSLLIGLLCSHCPFYPMSAASSRSYTEDSLAAVGASFILAQSNYSKEVNMLLKSLRATEKKSEFLRNLELQLFYIGDTDGSNRGENTICGDLAYCITTSGTTSKPKVVRVPHTCIVPNIVQLREMFKFKPGDRVLLTSPLTFDPSIVDIFCTLTSGACLVIVPQELKQRPEKLLNILHYKQRIAVMQATPSLMRSFGPGRLSQSLLGEHTSLRVLALGGEQFPDGKELRTWMHPRNTTTKMYNLYGITEVSCWASIHCVDLDKVLCENAPVPVGDALHKTCIKLEPLADGESVVDNSVESSTDSFGHILIGSCERVCTIDNEEMPVVTRTSKIVWRPTGDLGCRGPGSDIFYHGRLDSQIKRFGKRLNLVSVEEVMKQLPEVLDCHVVYHHATLAAFVIVNEQTKMDLSGKAASVNITTRTSAVKFPNTTIGTEIKPKINLEEMEVRYSYLPAKTYSQESSTAHTPQTEEKDDNLQWQQIMRNLRAHAEQKLPRHGVPDIFKQVFGSFPMTSHGKLDKRKLKQILDAHLDTVRENKMSPSLQDLWIAHLPQHRHEVQNDDNFLSMGGDSLSAVRLATVLETVTSLPMGHIYDVLVNKKFGSLVEYIDSNGQMFQVRGTNNGTSERKREVNAENLDMIISGRTSTSSNCLKPEEYVTSFNINDLYESKKFIANNSEEKPTKSVYLKSVTNISKAVKKATEDVDHGPSKAKRICEAPNSRIVTNLDNLPINTQFQSDEIKGKQKEQRCCAEPHNVRRIIQRGGKIFKFDDKQNPETRIKILPPNPSEKESCNPARSNNQLHLKRNIVDDCDCDEKKDEVLNLEMLNRNIQLELTIKWRFDTQKCVDASPLVVEYSTGDACVFIGSHSGLVSCLNLATGGCVWTTRLPDRVESSACCTTDGRHIVVGCYDRNIYTLCSASGNVVWCVETGEAVKCSPILNPVEGKILCGSHDGCLYCLDVEKRQQVWKTSLGEASVFSSPCLSRDGLVVYAATLAGNVVALDAQRGEARWKTSIEKPVFSLLCIIDGDLYVGCVDGKLYCLNSESGEIKWTYQAGAPIFSSPVHYKQFLLFGCHDFYIYCLNQDGQLVWKYETHATVYSTVFPWRLEEGVLSYTADQQKLLHEEDKPRNWKTKIDNEREDNLLTHNTNEDCDIEDGSYNNCIGSGNVYNQALIANGERITSVVSPNLRESRGSGRDMLDVVIGGDINGYVAKPSCAGSNDGGSECNSKNDCKKGIFTSHGNHSNCIAQGKSESETKSNNKNSATKYFGSPVNDESHNTGLICRSHTSTPKCQDVTAQITTDAVIVASTNGQLTVLDVRDGALLGDYRLPCQVFSSPVVAGGWIVVGCRDNYVYCLGIS